MKRWSLGLLTWGTYLAAATGIIYFTMKNYMEPVSPFAVINHPLQPWLLKAHILAGPLVVLALGAVLQGHFASQRAEGRPYGMRTGTWILLPAAVMVVSGYLIQVLTGERVLSTVGWIHLAAGVLFLLLLVSHRVVTRRAAGTALAGVAMLVILLALLLMPHRGEALGTTTVPVPAGGEHEGTVRGLWPVMGTLLTAELRLAPGEDDPEAALQAVRRTVFEVDSLMSTYRPQSDVSRLNRAAGKGEWTPLQPATREVLREALGLGHATEGRLDVTIGPLVGLWGFDGAPDGQDRPLPEAGRIDSALALTGQSRIRFSPDGESARLPQRGMRVDLGGIAKGWALDQAAASARSAGAVAGLLDLGGQILVFGEPPETGGWRIAVRDPRDPAHETAAFSIHAGSVATSGDYERFFYHDGKRYTHILDPRSGRPVSGVLSVTVWAATGAEADGWSTGLFVAGPDEGRRLIADRPGIGVLWIVSIPQEEGGGIRKIAAGPLVDRIAP